jgi:hypothetical protein
MSDHFGQLIDHFAAMNDHIRDVIDQLDAVRLSSEERAFLGDVDVIHEKSLERRRRSVDRSSRRK